MNAAPVFLLVEPSPMLCSSLYEWLESVLTDPRIFIAESGLEALNLAMQEKPSHILVEMDLPDTNGTEIVKQMSQKLPTARIIVTGWYDSRLILEIVQSAGADGFIPKNKLRNELLPLWGLPPR